MATDQWGYPLHETSEDEPEWDAGGDGRLTPDERRIERLTAQLEDARQTITALKEEAALKDVEITRLQRLAGAREQALLKADEMREHIGDDASDNLQLAALEYDRLCEIANDCAIALRGES